MSNPTPTVHLLHSDRPCKHARHYTGWSSNLDARLADYTGGQGARLLAVLKAAGVGWTLARTWTGDIAREYGLSANKTGVAQFVELQNEFISVRVFFNLSITTNGDRNAKLAYIENVLVDAGMAALARLNLWLVKRWKTLLASPLRASRAGYSGAQTIGSSRASVITDRDIPGVGDLRAEVTNTHGTPAGIAQSTAFILGKPPDGRSFVCLFIRSLSVVAVESRTHA